jgi:predicted ester cyclase
MTADGKELKNNNRRQKMDIKEFAEKFIKAEDEAWQTGNCAALEKLEDPTVVYHIPPMPDTVGWEGHKQYILGTRQAVSDLHQNWEYITGDGNVFSLSYKMRCISKGMIPGTKNGGKITSDSLFVFKLKGGKIIEAWSKGSMTGIDFEAALKAMKK